MIVDFDPKFLAMLAPFVAQDDAGERAAKALALIFAFSQTDGAHHKDWVMDQVVRVLTGEHYDEFVESFENHDGEHYTWDAGIAP